MKIKTRLSLKFSLNHNIFIIIVDTYTNLYITNNQIKQITLHIPKAKEKKKKSNHRSQQFKAQSIT